MLRALHMKDVGPAARLDLELGERLNVLTGDNGLGKSFVLEVAWWVATGTWVGRPVLPHRGKEDEAVISFQLDPANPDGPKQPSLWHGRPQSARFRRNRQDWQDPLGHLESFRRSKERMLTAAWLDELDWTPVVFAQADGAFSVWDPARNYSFRSAYETMNVDARPYHLGLEALWDGLTLDGKRVCNGLIQDWGRWWLEDAADKPSPFGLLRDVLRKLSHPSEPMEPGEPRRIYLDDARDFPTVALPYGNVPILHLSAGMKRIVSLAYLIAWAWTEHVKACELLGRKQAERLVFLMDEVESHLHPKWQRHILPRLLEVLAGLGPSLRPQLLVTTHSPMVLASLEPHWSAANDKLFLFELEERVGDPAHKEVDLDELPWVKYGDAVGWLTSPIFGLKQARSPEAEVAIKAAQDLMTGKLTSLPAGLHTAEEIDRELRRLLPDQDKFWPRWVVWQEGRST
jgi:AAA domain, putative AbiEii toxin, Type IV TA system